jgi:hypothetical protein
MFHCNVVDFNAKLGKILNEENSALTALPWNN